MTPHALITGASRGIGAAFARILAADGYGLALVARSAADLGHVADDIAKRSGVPVAVIAADLSRPEGIDALMAALAAQGLLPDILINNAGIGLIGEAVRLDRDRQLGIIDLNVRALTDLTLRLLPAMIAKSAGGVINVASLAGLVPGPGMAVYFASKAYVVSFTDALAQELDGTGVKAMSLSPGAVATGFQARAGMKAAEAMAFSGAMTAEQVAQAGWDGFKAGQRMVVPGLANKLSAYLGRAAPRRLVLPLMQRAMARMKE